MNSPNMPLIVSATIDHLYVKGLEVVMELMLAGIDEEGIFRTSGSSDQVRLLKDRLCKGIDKCDSVLNEEGEQVDLNTIEDVHIISGALKLFFRELSEPIMTSEMYDAFIATAGTG